MLAILGLADLGFNVHEPVYELIVRARLGRAANLVHQDTYEVLESLFGVSYEPIVRNEAASLPLGLRVAFLDHLEVLIIVLRSQRKSSRREKNEGFLGGLDGRGRTI